MSRNTTPVNEMCVFRRKNNVVRHGPLTKAVAARQAIHARGYQAELRVQPPPGSKTVQLVKGTLPRLLDEGHS